VEPAPVVSKQLPNPGGSAPGRPFLALSPPKGSPASNLSVR
jgi:hypothetical protein